jgi:hypothetical protein
MACPICDHTMHNLIVSPQEAISIFWCPRCGSVVTRFTSPSNLDIPSLPARVRKFLELIDDDDDNAPAANDVYEDLRGHAHRIGLYESCMPESERP